MINRVSSSAGRSAVILIVDDAPDALHVLRTSLLQQGYQTHIANSGEQALALARSVHPDLILLDVVMPGIDGFETCRRLKADAATSAIPVIFMSACNDTDAVVSGFEHGAIDYLSKPLHMAEVCARVRAQLYQRTHSDNHQQQAERLRTIVNSMAEGLMMIDADGVIQSTNPACDRYLGYSANELAGRSISTLLSAAVAAEYLDDFARYVAHPDGAHLLGAREVTLAHRDGGSVCMDLTLTPMSGRAPLFIGLLHDITRHKQHEDALQRAAQVDPLTHIANRRHFDSFLDHEWQRALRTGTPMSLVVLDVDHFKLYNDALGHQAGDHCLQQVAEATQAHAMRPTDLAARYGGEEFALLFAETSGETALALAEAIRRHVEHLHLPHPRSPSSPWLTVSVGVASMVPTPQDAVQTLFAAADRAMYASKDGGRNRVTAVAPGNAECEALLALMLRAQPVTPVSDNR